MKDTFDFPRFEDLQLGSYGKRDGCGCLAAKIHEVEWNSRLAGFVFSSLFPAVDEELADGEFGRLLFISDNILSDRHKAYNALVRATEKVLNVEIGP